MSDSTFRATVDRKLFLTQALPYVDFDRISISVHGGIFSVASFGNAVNFRLPAYVIKPGQVFLTTDEWKSLVSKVQESTGKMIDIEL